MPFSAKWFFIYYLSLALLFMVGGGYLIFRKDKATNWLLKSANDENPPVLLIRTFKYVTLFTLPGLVISFFPFSWVELVFCLRSEEHTSELQSRFDLVCSLLLEKKK